MKASHTPRMLSPMRLFTLVITLSLALLAARPAQADSATPNTPIQVFLGPAAADDPAGVHAGLLKFLSTAKTQIVGSIHELDMIDIADLLAKKKKQGLTVRLTVEAKWYAAPKCQAAREVLETAGVEVIPDNRATGLMHNKFWVVDGVRVWTGSTNLTSSCLFYNPNNALWIENTAVAANFTTEFDEEAKGRFGKKGSGIANTPNPKVKIGATLVKTYFAPDDEPIPAVVAEIDQAKSSIDIMCFVFSSQEICEALLKAHARGIKVRVLLDNTFKPEAATSRWKYIPSKELAKAQVPLRWDHDKSKLHHKVLIIDSASPTATVITGSMNFSSKGATENDDNLLIVTSPEVAKPFAKCFEALWNDAGQVTADTQPSDKTGDDDGQD
jgi:phosphatidylserine/phosphatidylglycerophosphate/cardiolipin synthase-like enzyme